MQTKFNKPLLISLISLSLAACDTTNSLSKDDIKTVKELPHANKAIEAAARIASVKAHEAKVNEYLSQAQQAWETEDLDRLDSIYKELAAYDAGNLRAEEGLRNVGLARHHLELLAEAKSHLGRSDADDEIAKEKLHEILLERPDHPVAKPLYEALLKKQETVAQEKSHKKLVYKNPVTMQFRDVSLKMIFEALAKTTRINFILDKDVPSDQKATIYVENMLFNDALDLLLQTNQLEKKVLSENSAIIYVNDVLHQRDYKDLSVRNFTLDFADVKQVSTTLRSMLNIKQIEIDPRLNALMIKDTPEVIALAEKLITSLDLPDPEVMLEMEVLEVKRSRLQDLGVKVPTSLDVPIPTNGLTLGQLKSTPIKSFNVGGAPGFNFSANDSDVNLLANPRIRVKNKDVAKIHIGERVPVFTANISSTGVSSQTVQYIDAGLKLEAEPNISASGDVTIKINLNVGSIGDTITNGQSTAFRVGTRSATTQLRLHDGETQILAGLIDDQDRKNVDKIPGIGNIPLLGKLFSKQKDDKSKTEIVLSITPHIIRERKTADANQTEYWVGSEAQTGKHSSIPNFGAGGMPFFVPKAPTPAPTNKDDKPQSLNVPLPPGFSLGNGLGGDTPAKKSGE
jgi:general secretion pathway protein D